MRLLRRLAVLATVLALGWLLAPGAAAGGATSVLLTVPSSGETASLHHSQQEYETLRALLHPDPTGGAKPPRPVTETDVKPGEITVSWLLHEVHAWRTDRVEPADRAGVVWINTTLDPGASASVRHRAADPVRLTALLTKLSLMDGKATVGAAEAREQRQESPVTTRAAGSSDVLRGWWWGIPGLTLGAGVVLALRPMAARLLAPPAIRKK